MDPLALAIISTVGSAFIIGVGAFAIKLMFAGLKAWMDREVRAHLVPNGGGSLADALKRIERQVEYLTELHKSNPGHSHESGVSEG